MYCRAKRVSVIERNFHSDLMKYVCVRACVRARAWVMIK